MFLFHFDVLEAVNVTKILVGINMFILLAIGSRIFFFFGLFFPIHLALKSNNYVQRQIEVSLLLKDKAWLISTLNVSFKLYFEYNFLFNLLWFYSEEV